MQTIMNIFVIVAVLYFFPEGSKSIPCNKSKHLFYHSSE